MFMIYHKNVSTVIEILFAIYCITVMLSITAADSVLSLPCGTIMSKQNLACHDLIYSHTKLSDTMQKKPSTAAGGHYTTESLINIRIQYSWTAEFGDSRERFNETLTIRWVINYILLIFIVF